MTTSADHPSHINKQVNGSGSSAWSRGPPPVPNHTVRTISPVANQQYLAENGNAQHHDPSTNVTTTNGNGTTPVIVEGGHSRKGSLMVGGGLDIKRGNIAFGTVDSPNPLLSSSPAAPSMTGTHLADTVKSFGSIDADAATDPNAVKASRRVSVMGTPVASPPAAAKQLDLHAMFGAKAKPNGATAMSPPPDQSVPDRRQSTTFQNGMPGQLHLRPPQPGMMQPRSPTMGPPMSHIQQGFRPHIPPNGLQQTRPQGMLRPNMMGQQGMGYMHPGQQGSYPTMGYPGQGYYDGYTVYSSQQFGMPQWAPQQHPQNQQFHMQSPHLSSTGPQPSPSPHTSALPSSGRASPVPGAAPTPPSRPPSLIGHQPAPSNASLSSIPSTPSRPMQPTPSFTPQSNQSQGVTTPYGLSGGAASFTPRASKAIKLTRPDGSALDLKAAAAAAGKAPSPLLSAPATPEIDSQPEVPKKKITSLPVMVRLESEDQKKTRIAEEDRQARIKKEEDREEQERKERRDRKEREEAERKEKERLVAQQAKNNAESEKVERQREAEEQATVEAKRKLQEAFLAEQAAAKRAEEDRNAAADLEAHRRGDEKAAATPIAAEEARDLAEDKSRAFVTPTQPSSVSPPSSPSLATAGLPPKPTGSVTSRRPAPAALDIKPSSPSISEDVPTDTISALSTARPIDDIHAIVYPGSLRSPAINLNVDAKPGKFRYDRDFLMQFMNVCRDKPEGLPNLEEIGLGTDASSGFGNSRSSRGSRTSMGSGRGALTTGLGIGVSGRSSVSNQGMGSFGMGNFSSGSLRGSTSEERYNRSIASGRQGSMARTPSQGGPGTLPHMGLPSMGLSASRTGANRSQRGTKRLPQDSRFSLEPDVAPLVSSSNSWVKSRPTGNDEGSPAFIERKVKALLNKLTAEKFESIAKQILEWANKSANETDGMTLKLVIKQIFEKATDEAHWSSMYARLCKMLLDQLDEAITEHVDGKPVSGGMLFRKYLVGRCQVDFESGWKAREDAANAAAAKSEEDKERLAQHEKNQEEGSGEAAMLSEEYYVAQKAKRRGLGLVQLIGELYKLDMLGKGVIRQCFVKLLGNIDNPDEEDVESSCKLLATVGRSFEIASPENMSVVLDRLDHIVRTDGVASRIKFMIMDTMDLRKSGWVSRNKQAGVMTIAEIHQQAAREQAEKSAAVAQVTRDSISRGGSRGGHARRDGSQVGEWQAVAQTSRPTPRPQDFSNIGRNISSTLPSAPTFGGPSSVFHKRGGKPNGPGGTPPISRQASTVNMFSALSAETQEGVVEQRQGGETAERPKMKLLPRTKPLPGPDSTEDLEGANGAEDEEDEEEEAPISMSEEMAKGMVDNDLKEFWGEKYVGGTRNPEEAVEYFRELPNEHQGILAKRMVEDVFTISKTKDAEVVAEAYSLALEQGVVPKETLVEAITTRMTSLDDDSIDFPQAYKAIAYLVRSISLTVEEIADLVKQVAVDGEPKIGPDAKFNKALAAVDAEA